VIIEMARVRVAGPSRRCGAALALLQDIGDLHLIASAEPVDAATMVHDPGSPKPVRQARHLLGDVEAVLAMLPTAAAPQPASTWRSAWPVAARVVRRWRRELTALSRRRDALADEQSLLLQYRIFIEAFEPLLKRAARWPDARVSFVLLRPGASVDEIDRKLREVVGDQVELHSRALPSGETAVLMLAAGSAATQLRNLLASARLEDLPVPPGLDGHDLLHAMPALVDRLAQVESELAAAQARRIEIADEARSILFALQARLHDQLLLAEARTKAQVGELMFRLEGWIPAPAVKPLRERIARELGPEILVAQVATEPWTRVDAPVELSNPRLFRSFELITRAFPLPRYGSIDPTPFVAVFFPMFFGLMLGDVGYGLVLAAIAAVLIRRARPASARKAIAEMALACALFAIVFGVLFGELFGTLGREFGMRPLAFDREHALVPFLVFTVALGTVHVLLGLTLGLVGQWRQGHRREALGRGLTMLMIVLTVLALLAAFRVLPPQLFTPAAIALLVAFPALIALEGIIAVIELMSAFGHILSYARIMALGTASLMLAMIANRMVGALGSALVGVAFALLFHLVNFAIGLFSPAIHSLRLHYVEFFGEFYSPGGTAYRPLGHWRPALHGAA
jgi:V/A-type H+/Na+-transporting ATPase subunit I